MRDSIQFKTYDKEKTPYTDIPLTLGEDSHRQSDKGDDSHLGARDSEW